MARDDNSILEALLGDERLTEAEQTAFGDMRRKLRFGYLKKLTTSQREWAEERYLNLELDAHEPSENLFSNGVVPASPSTRPLLDYERMPKPLKPPGRQ